MLNVKLGLNFPFTQVYAMKTLFFLDYKPRYRDVLRERKWMVSCKPRPL